MNLTPAMAAAADRALASGFVEAFTDGGQPLVAVPDVVLVEGAANEQPTPPTLTVGRKDGREVSFYRQTPRQP